MTAQVADRTRPRLPALPHRPSVRTLVGLALLGLLALPATMLAVDKDKALYIGGTLADFPGHATPLVSWGAVEIRGRIDLRSETDLTFDAGRWGILSIPYQGVSSLQYGWQVDGTRFRKQAYGVDAGSDLQRQGLLIIPWDPFEQFTNKVHYVLTVGYRDGSGQEQAVVLELGKDLVRPTLQALERRSGRGVEFTDVTACMLVRTADACGYGRPAELAGLGTAHLDARVGGDYRVRILAEVEKDGLGIEWTSSPEDAEMLLTFQGARSFDPACPCEGGRGEVSITHDGSRRVVLVFTGSKKGIWGTNPATGFGRAFAKAFRDANPGSRH